MNTNLDYCLTKWKRHLLTAILWVAVLLTAFSYAWVPLRSSQDDWWHLKTGQWIVQNSRLPVYDLFTYTGENTLWHNHEWLSQIVFWLVYDAFGGLTALITFKALFFVLIIAGVAWLARIRCGSWIVALTTAWIAAEISRRFTFIRPPLFSFALFTLYIGMFDAWRRDALSPKILAPVTLILMVLWANLHGMCLLGIVVAGCYAGGETATWLWSKFCKMPLPPLRRMIFAYALTGGLVLVALCNPAGYELFFLSSKFMNDPYLKQTINEMLPPPFFMHRATPESALRFVPGFAAFWFAGAAFVGLLLYKRRLPSWADFYLSGFCLLQAALHWRLLPLFAIAAAGPSAWLVVQCMPQSPVLRARLTGGIAALCLLGAGAMTLAVGEPQPYIQRNMMMARGSNMDPASYPEPLIRFIERANLPDRMFSPSNYCGYFMWRLSPEKHKLFTDNRYDIWGSQWYVPHEVICAGSEAKDNILSKSWRDLLDEHGINFIVINRDAPLQKKLVAERTASGSGATWQQIYYWVPPGGSSQGGFSVWLRNDGSEARRDLINRCLKQFSSYNPQGLSPAEMP